MIRLANVLAAVLTLAGLAAPQARAQFRGRAAMAYHPHWGCFGYCPGPLPYHPVRHWGCYGYCPGPLPQPHHWSCFGICPRPGPPEYWGCFGYCNGPLNPPAYGCYGYCPYGPTPAPPYNVVQYTPTYVTNVGGVAAPSGRAPVTDLPADPDSQGKSVDELVKQLKSGTADARLRAAIALARLGPRARTAIGALVEALGDAVAPV